MLVPCVLLSLGGLGGGKWMGCGDDTPVFGGAIIIDFLAGFGGGQFVVFSIEHGLQIKSYQSATVLS